MADPHEEVIPMFYRAHDGCTYWMDRNLGWVCAPTLLAGGPDFGSVTSIDDLYLDEDDRADLNAWLAECPTEEEIVEADADWRKYAAVISVAVKGRPAIEQVHHVATHEDVFGVEDTPVQDFTTAMLAALDLLEASP